MQSIGVVVIGRNEGKRLQQCLRSVISEGVIVVYVDSGSTDDSVAMATSLGVHVITLDLSIPFTAARARNAGFEMLMKLAPNLEYVQFVDGDCQIMPSWLNIAADYLKAWEQVVVVCGRRREEFPNDSVYNRLCDIEWDTPIGETNACGGDSMMRVSAFKAVGGFNPSLIAGEEPELCLRLRALGGKIVRLDEEMTLHDAQITNIKQWWKRSLRAGHAYAQGARMHGHNSERYWVRESRSIWLWGLVLPLIAVTTSFLTSGISLLLLVLAYILLIYRIYKYGKTRSFKSQDATLYAINCVLSKFPQVQGQIQFHLSRLLKRQSTLVEYKNATS
ncbi:family 2 glycosyl transferase [Calothrix sp. NIES-4071]|nr:family 2 glycosyl transferase [Calothrix sp. NIES-4071]BAZ62667.1 family 2 glycosyl transferase [Calothrix sp. NIES-4105]